MTATIIKCRKSNYWYAAMIGASYPVIEKYLDTCNDLVINRGDLLASVDKRDIKIEGMDFIFEPEPEPIIEQVPVLDEIKSFVPEPLTIWQRIYYFIIRLFQIIKN